MTKAPRPADVPGGRPGLATRRELGPVNGTLEAIAARVTGRRRLGVFAAIGRSRRLFRGWLHYSATMMPFGDLPRKETELVILRIAALRGSAYERDHHRVIARRAGATAAEMDAVDGDAHGFGGRMGAILDVVDELVRNRDVADATWAALAEHLTDRECVALVQLTTHYDGLATALHVLGVPPDEPR